MRKIAVITAIAFSSSFAFGGADSASMAQYIQSAPLYLSQPGVVTTQSIPLPTNVPSGTLCGAMEDWNWSPVPCMGQDIRTGCPSGFFLTAIYNNRNNVLYTCRKA
ncbi:hypothetical protein [Burkholderia contaminans]|uniref:hypothetical protein n=1 Tax=Burkholderia contaminans TaxID=488447 RepID=UPI00158B983B|nr:hypothetical protein [Burkholderia contaminans]